MKLDFSKEKPHYSFNLQLRKKVILIVGNMLNLDDDLEVSLTLVSDETMLDLNTKYRGISKTTDVLSFAFNESGFKSILLGDIYISYPQAVRQSKEYGTGLTRELAFLLIHGLLHLLGYDHINLPDEKKMFKLQNKILKEVLDGICKID
jgi:probable rRNA maturation factor